MSLYPDQKRKNLKMDLQQKWDQSGKEILQRSSNVGKEKQEYNEIQISVHVLAICFVNNLD